MILQMLPGLSCIFSAAFFKAVADTLAHHFDTSVFRRKWNSPFWNPMHRHNDAVKKIFGYPLDAWHLANSAMIICFLLPFGWKMVILGIVFNLAFNLFYNKILRR